MCSLCWKRTLEKHDIVFGPSLVLSANIKLTENEKVPSTYHLLNNPTQTYGNIWKKHNYIFVSKILLNTFSFSFYDLSCNIFIIKNIMCQVLGIFFTQGNSNLQPKSTSSLSEFYNFTFISPLWIFHSAGRVLYFYRLYFQ